MNFALDMHGVYMVDPDLWDAWIELAKTRGHTVFIVSGGHPEQPQHEGWQRIRTKWPECQVIWCLRRPKKRECERLGVKIDVWIDDVPLKIYKSGVQNRGKR